MAEGCFCSVPSIAMINVSNNSLINLNTSWIHASYEQWNWYRQSMPYDMVTLYPHLPPHHLSMYTAYSRYRNTNIYLFYIASSKHWTRQLGYMQVSDQQLASAIHSSIQHLASATYRRVDERFQLTFWTITTLYLQYLLVGVIGFLIHKNTS